MVEYDLEKIKGKKNKNSINKVGVFVDSIENKVKESVESDKRQKILRKYNVGKKHEYEFLNDINNLPLFIDLMEKSFGTNGGLVNANILYRYMRLGMIEGGMEKISYFGNEMLSYEENSIGNENKALVMDKISLGSEEGRYFIKNFDLESFKKYGPDFFSNIENKSYLSYKLLSDKNIRKLFTDKNYLSKYKKLKSHLKGFNFKALKELNYDRDDLFFDLLDVNDINLFLELCDELEISTANDEWFAIKIEESLKFYKKFGKLGINNLKLLNPYLSNPLKIDFFIDYNNDEKLNDNNEAIFKIETDVLKKVISLIEKKDLNLSYNGLLSIISENINKFSVNLENEIDKAKFDISGSINSILNDNETKKVNNDESRNQQETYEVIELFYNNLGKEFLISDEIIFKNILNLNKKKSYFQKNIFDVYNLKSENGILFLRMIFSHNPITQLENYKKLETSIPEVFGYKKFVEGGTIKDTSGPNFNINNVIKNKESVDNFLIYALKFKDKLIKSPVEVINNINIKNHFQLSGKNGIGLKNIKNIEEIFGIEISYEDFNNTEGVFIVGADLKNEFEYLNNKFPNKIKTLNDLKEFNAFCTILSFSTNEENDLYSFFLDKLNYTEEDFKNEEKIRIISSLDGSNKHAFEILEKEFGLDIVLKYLGNSNPAEGLNYFDCDDLCFIGNNISKLMLYVGELDLENKYNILGKLVDKIKHNFEFNKITEQQIDKIIELIDFYGLERLDYRLVNNYIFLNDKQKEDDLLAIPSELLEFDLVSEDVILNNISFLLDEVTSFRENFKGKDKDGEGLKQLLNLIYKKYFICSLGEDISSAYTTRNYYDAYNGMKKIEGSLPPELSDVKPNFLPINSDNFLDFFEDDEIILSFEKDNGVKFEGNLVPWTKAWFMEKPERKQYLSYEKYKTFEKFGTIIGLGQIEGSSDSESFKSYYKDVFENISLEKSRTNILQLGEVFSLILRENNYYIFDELVENEINIGEDFKNFIEKYNISDKGRTILTLLIIREIKNSFSIFKDKSGKNNIDSLSAKELLLIVYKKFKKYNEIIETYDNVPIKTSIGMEYEVTESIAKGYEESVGSNYKKDIEIISDYSGVAKGNDAVHEIATKPTDNPYLLILEMQLLQDLDFVDLNFKKQDYSKGSRGLHLTIGSEMGVKLDENTNFIQNILIASNIGGVNAGEEISIVNGFGSIREKGWDCEAVFGEEKTQCVEFRSLSLDKAEQFERLVLSLFNLNMINQANNIIKDSVYIEALKIQSNTSEEEFLEMIFNNLKFATIDRTQKLKYGINNYDEIILLYKYLLFKKDIENIIQNHNENFEKNEVIDESKLSGLGELIRLYNSTSPTIKLLKKNDISIYYLKEIFEDGILNKNDFIEYLKSDGKLDGYTNRQINIIYENYNLRISKVFNKLKKENFDAYKNIGEYLDGDIEEIIRKLTNNKRFKEVIGDDKSYLENIYINELEIEKEVTVELINMFTKINNLFVKKDSTNALSMLDTTKEKNGELISDSRLTEMTIFDRLDRGFKTRKGYNVIQGASENMLTQAIQKRILEFNNGIEKMLTKKS